MLRPLRLGLIGTGVAARELYLPALRELKGRVEVVACANRRRSKAEAFARLAGVKTVVDSGEELIALREVDAVFISLPIHLQPTYVLMALQADKAVLSEKPVAPNVREARKLLRAAARYEAPWLVGENYAFMSHVRQLRQWIVKGRIGDVRLVEVMQITKMDRENPYFHTAWRAKPQHAGGFVVDAGVHLAHVVRRCFGMPTEVRGFVARFDPKLMPIDSAVAVLRFESGALGTWTSCFSAKYDGPILRVCGDRGCLELFPDRAILRTGSGKETLCAIECDSFVEELEHFAEVVQRGKTVAVSPEEALLDLAFVESLCGLRH